MRNLYPPLAITTIFMFCCPHRNQIKQFLSSAPPPVSIGYYPDYHYSLSPTHTYYEKIKDLREDIESNEPILRKLIREHIPVKSPLEFNFSYAGIDSVNHRLILRYFAPNLRSEEIAGWQVQIIYRLPGPILERAFVWSVPLE
ncbi:MAG: hypothetical protein ACUVUR_00270 [bacterium]